MAVGRARLHRTSPKTSFKVKHVKGILNNVSSSSRKYKEMFMKYQWRN